MKAALIDPDAKTLSIIDLDLSGEDGFLNISKSIGCEFFTCVTLAGREDGSETLYCDDVGMFATEKKNGVMHAIYGPIFGKCLIMGTDHSGVAIDTKVENRRDLLALNLMCFVDRDGNITPLPES